VADKVGPATFGIIATLGWEISVLNSALFVIECGADSMTVLPS